MTKIIGISGIGGSGKTTLTRALGKKLHATTLFWDDYDAISLAPSDYVAWYHTSRNYNDWKYDELAHTLKSLKEGKVVTCPATKRALHPTQTIIFDAPMGRKHKATGQYIDYEIFLDTPPDIALSRRLLRDYQNTPQKMSEEINYYLTTSRPVYLLFYETKNDSDCIIDGSLDIDTLVNQVINKIT